MIRKGRGTAQPSDSCFSSFSSSSSYSSFSPPPLLAPRELFPLETIEQCFGPLRAGETAVQEAEACGDVGLGEEERRKGRRGKFRFTTSQVERRLCFQERPSRPPNASRKSIIIACGLLNTYSSVAINRVDYLLACAHRIGFYSILLINRYCAAGTHSNHQIVNYILVTRTTAVIYRRCRSPRLAEQMFPLPLFVHGQSS